MMGPTFDASLALEIAGLHRARGEGRPRLAPREAQAQVRSLLAALRSTDHAWTYRQERHRHRRRRRDRQRHLPALRRLRLRSVGVFDKNLDGAKKIADEIKGATPP